MGKPAGDVFDAKVSPPELGAGKQVLEFHKNQHVFEHLSFGARRPTKNNNIK